MNPWSNHSSPRRMRTELSRKTRHVSWRSKWLPLARSRAKLLVILPKIPLELRISKRSSLKSSTVICPGDWTLSLRLLTGKDSPLPLLESNSPIITTQRFRMVSWLMSTSPTESQDWIFWWTRLTSQSSTHRSTWTCIDQMTLRSSSSTRNIMTWSCLSWSRSRTSSSNLDMTLVSKRWEAHRMRTKCLSTTVWSLVVWWRDSWTKFQFAKRAKNTWLKTSIRRCPTSTYFWDKELLSRTYSRLLWRLVLRSVRMTSTLFAREFFHAS